MKQLLKITGFAPYLLIVFLNAMTDLGHKIILQNTIFKAYEGSELMVLTALVNALILLPFIFLFSPAGYISDRYAKSKVIEKAAFAAIVITLLITLSYSMGWFWIAFVLTFILAAQSAIYSPAKYGLIKEMTGNEHLAEANAAVQAITVIAILLGALIYSIFFESLLHDQTLVPDEILRRIAPLGFVLVAASSVEYLLAHRLAATLQASSPIQNDRKEGFAPASYFKLDYLKENLKVIRSSEAIWLSIIGLSILWGISQVVVAIFGEYLKEELGILNTVTAQGLLTLSGLGMIAGSLMAGRVSKNYIETGIIPIGALGVALTLYWLPSLHSTLSLGIDLFAFGLFAGLFMVPLNALIQFASPVEHLGKVLAGNNFMQNLSMFGFLMLTVLFAAAGLSSRALFYLIATVAFVGMGYTFVKLPQSLVRYVVRMIIGVRYRLSVEGLEHIDSDKGVLLLGNHISFLDWAILQMAYPKQIRFVMDRSYYDKWYLKPILNFFGVIPISSRGSKSALAKVTEALNNGDTVALFPEGHITRNGHLSSFKQGFERACEALAESDATIVPFYLRGLWEDSFSYASKKLRRKKSKDISVYFGEAMSIHSKADAVKRAVFDLSVRSWQAYAAALPSLQEAWFETLKEEKLPLFIADSTGVELSQKRFALAVLLFRAKLAKELGDAKRVGIIMPSSVAGSIVQMALLSLGKTIVNLNYSAGDAALLHAVKTTGIRHVVTSERFVTRLGAKGFDLSALFSHVTKVEVESLKGRIGKLETIVYGTALTLLPHALLKALFITPRANDQEAAILFSSGSEGNPKGIVLTHRNIMGNIKQIVTVLNPSDEDRILATLPTFHSFGLTVTTLLPLIEAIPSFAHPDPTDGYGIGKLAAKYRATILCATATFLRLYTRNRKLLPLMFEDLRYVIAGAEKLPEEVRSAFKAKFGKEIYEGYGATETTPVATVNLPDRLIVDDWKVQVGNKPGTVGLPVPGSAIRIVDPESFETLPIGEEGMILIGGTQIMQGYLKDPEKTASVIKEIDGIRWYVTGDKGRLDEDGFLTIVDRYSRFAKIGGEMVSLGMVEQEIGKILEADEKIAVTAIPDAKKGEAIVLLFEGSRDIEELMAQIGTLGLNPLYVPSKAYKVDALPVLGTGKADFKGAKKLAQELSDGKQ